MPKYRISIVNDDTNEEVINFQADEYEFSNSSHNGAELHASKGVMASEAQPVKRKGGRPAGSKNKPKNGTPILVEEAVTE